MILIKRLREVIGGVLVLIGLVIITGCAHPQLQDRVQTVEVRVPVRTPCPNRADVRPLPNRVRVDHPTMPTVAGAAEPDWQAISRILGAKIIELFTYADAAHEQLVACSAP